MLNFGKRAVRFDWFGAKISSIVLNENEPVLCERENNNHDERLATCFSNNLILKKILSKLPTSKLLRCSLVNKLWNQEARLILKNSRMVVVNIGPADPCQDLNRLLGVMANMTVVPYNGLRVTIDRTTLTSFTGSNCHCSIEPSDSVELSSSKFKYLEINWKTWTISKYGDCQVIAFVRAMLNSNRLIELFLRVNGGAPMHPVPFLRQGQVQLDKLKVLKLLLPSVSQGDMNAIKTIVFEATNLVEVWHDGRPYISEILLDIKKAHLIKYFEFHSTQDLLNQTLASCGPQLCELTALATDFMHFDVRSIRTLNCLLESSSCSLKILRIDAVLLYGISRAKIALKNVKILNVLIECPPIHVGGPVVYSVLRRINFTQTFPRLSRIEFLEGSVRSTESVIQMFPAEEENYEGSSSKVKHVSFHGCLRTHTLENFVGIFPSIISLFASFCRMDGVPFGQIWTGWPSLEEIVLSVKELGWCRWHQSAINLDAALCGISEEEVAELRKIDREGLERAQIVPIRPSIVNLKGLKKLGISLRGSETERSVPYPRALCLSKVGAILGIRRLSGLRVIISTDGQDLTQDLTENGLGSVLFSSSLDLVVELA